MTTFGLVHGAWHGGWCWSKLAPKLAAAGHGFRAVDLPCDDVAAGWERYARTALDAVSDADDDLVLVGHSLGGGVIPLVAARRFVRRLVFLCSFPPIPGESLDDSVSREHALIAPRALSWRDCLDTDGRYIWPNFESAYHAMYHDCAFESAAAAFERLRPQGRLPFTEPWPVDTWPETPVTFIVCDDDRLGSHIALKRVAKRRFGVEAIEVPGSHSPFLSRPADLAKALCALVG